MLRNASLRFLRDEGYRLLSQTLPVLYAENVLPLIQKFCSAPIEKITEIKGDGEFQGQDADADAADMPLDRSDSSSEARHADDSICATKKGLEKQGPNKIYETNAKVSVPLASQEAHCHEKKLPDKAYRPLLLKVILNTPANSLRTVLDKWVEDGNCVETNDLRLVYSHLRKHHLSRKALQFMEWIERGKRLPFEEHDYAFHVDLIGRYNGIEAAQKYIERVPKSFRNQVLYENILTACVRMSNIKKAEEIFHQEMMNLSSPLTVSACNQMLSLYQKIAPQSVRVAREKVDDILMIMEKKNVKPSSFTYKVLINLNMRSHNTSGMESVIHMMKANGIEPNVATQTMIAKFYISEGLTEKAEAVLKAMEVQINDKPCAIESLLDLYAILGRPDDVARIWKLCTEPRLRCYFAAIGAWGKLGHIKQAEEIFEIMLKSSQKLISAQFNAILNVYAENKLLSRGIELLERMHSLGCPNDHLTWNAIRKLYVNSGEVKKADSSLLNEAEKVADRNRLFCSYKKLLVAHAKKGDIHGAEEVFDRMEKLGCPGTPGGAAPYDCLLEAYANAFRKGMKAHKVLPSNTRIKQSNRLKNLQKGGETE